MMTAEIFNPNPIVFSAPKSSGRKVHAPVNSLWIDGPNQSDDETDEVEVIDQDEIFGTANSLHPPHPALTLWYRSHSLNIRPRTPEHP